MKTTGFREIVGNIKLFFYLSLLSLGNGLVIYCIFSFAIFFINLFLYFQLTLLSLGNGLFIVFSISLFLYIISIGIFKSIFIRSLDMFQVPIHLHVKLHRL